jgi:hypothetical protein
MQVVDGRIEERCLDSGRSSGNMQNAMLRGEKMTARGLNSSWFAIIRNYNLLHI